MKILLVTSLFLILACQKERKPCKFQGVEVSCDALQEQFLLQQQQAPKPVATGPVELAREVGVVSELAIELKRSSFTVIESMISTQQLLSEEKTHDCSVGAINDDKATVVGEELHFRMDRKLHKFKLKERKSAALSGSTWTHRKEHSQVIEETLLTLTADKVRLQKTCQWKDEVPQA